MPRPPLTDLQKHLIDKHGFNNDTARIWTTYVLNAQHDRYHAYLTARWLDHDHAEKKGD